MLDFVLGRARPRDQVRDLGGRLGGLVIREDTFLLAHETTPGPPRRGAGMI